MSNLDNRVNKLEEKHAPEVEMHIFVYYHDERGYAATSNGPRFATLDELSAALEWQPTKSDTMLSVIFADPRPDPDIKVLIPYNGRDPE